MTFAEIWLVDFEFIARDGERPEPICLVALELCSGRLIRLWRDEFGDQPPYRTDAGVLFVAYFASAELGCHLALGWPMPERVLDLYVEFRRHTNGLPLEHGAGLIGALSYFGLDSIGALEKEAMRQRKPDIVWVCLAVRSGMPGRRGWPRSAPTSSTTSQATCARLSGCGRQWRRISIGRGHCCAVGIWPLWRAWNMPAYRSTPHAWRCCVNIGSISRTS